MNGGGLSKLTAFQRELAQQNLMDDNRVASNMANYADTDHMLEKDHQFMYGGSYYSSGKDVLSKLSDAKII